MDRVSAIIPIDRSQPPGHNLASTQPNNTKLETAITINSNPLQLQRRNAQLTQNNQTMSSRKPSPPAKSRRSPPGTKSNSKSPQRKPKRTKSRIRWLSILVVFLGIAIICGTFGFLITKIFIIR
jgi:hypothetical protein